MREAYYVAPFAGAWIEMGIFTTFDLQLQQVAPFAGAWIEIDTMNYMTL